MASPMRLPDVLRKLRRLGCTYRRTGNNYVHIQREVSGRVRTGNMPTVQGRRVRPCYIRQIKTQLGISDSEWDAA